MDLEFEYSGEMDEQGRAHGYGTAVERTGRPLRASKVQAQKGPSRGPDGSAGTNHAQRLEKSIGKRKG